MSETVKEYSNGDITIEWRPELCQHSAHCFRSLPSVFNPRVRPWIQPEHASTEELTVVVHRCPSGALRLKNDTTMQSVEVPVSAASKSNEEVVIGSDASTTNVVIEVEPGGPYKVQGKVRIKNHDGTTEVKDASIELCRCGKSNSKPYCDYTHEQYPDWDQQ